MFSTHKGLFRCKRLNMDISCASEMFQNVVQQVLKGIHSQINISDDVLAFGKN